VKFYASGLLFDNDGVLVDSHHAAIAAWAQWCSEYAPTVNWNTPDNAGVRAEDRVRLWISSPELFEEANNRINQLEQDSSGDTVALAGAVELLTSIPAGTWTICTSANVNLGRARIIAAGLPVLMRWLRLRMWLTESQLQTLICLALRGWVLISRTVWF